MRTGSCRLQVPRLRSRSPRERNSTDVSGVPCRRAVEARDGPPAAAPTARPAPAGIIPRTTGRLFVMVSLNQPNRRMLTSAMHAS